MSQPTMEELRAMAPGKGLYAGVPGRGPVGMTCHSCAFLLYTGHNQRNKHPKCGKARYTHGDATTIRTSTPSCQHYEPERP